MKQNSNAPTDVRFSAWLDRLVLGILLSLSFCGYIPKRGNKVWSRWLGGRNDAEERLILRGNKTRLQISNLSLKAQVFFYKCRIIQVGLCNWLGLWVARCLLWPFGVHLELRDGGGRSNAKLCGGATKGQDA